MRVLRTHIGLVITCVAAPAANDAVKKSTGVSRCEGWLRSQEMARSERDLKKKKEAHEVALPMRLGVRPR